MKFVILVHSSPQPWGHPTGDFVAEHQALPQEQHDEMDARFGRLLTDMQEKGELVTAEALGDPARATLHRWADGDPVASDGPYAAGEEHLAGYFLVDVVDRERAEEIARHFAGPGETIELRPVMRPDGEEQ